METENISNKLLTELITYEDLTRNIEMLNNELSSLSGKNDTDSIRRINEIERELNAKKEERQKYDGEKIAKVSKYFKIEREFSQISEKLREYKKVSKKFKTSNQTLTADGRKVYIENSFLDEYNKLADMKKKLAAEESKAFQDIKGFTTTKKTERAVSNESQNNIEEEYVLPNIQQDLKLTPEEQKKELEEILNRIIQSAKLPNQGRKEIVTYKGNKYTIPTIYKGKFKNAAIQLENLNNKLNSNNVKTESTANLENTVSVSQQMEPEQFGFAENLSEQQVSQEQYQNIPFRPEIQVEKLNQIANTVISNIIKNKLHQPKNINKKTFKINLKKAFVCIKNKKAILKAKLFFSLMNKAILEYRIINRKVNFNSNSCQRINSENSEIVATEKGVVDEIKKPFDYLRENMQNDVKREELKSKIEEVRKANREKTAALKRIKTNPNIGGYVGTIAITIIGILILATIIFIGIGSIINR